MVAPGRGGGLCLRNSREREGGGGFHIVRCGGLDVMLLADVSSYINRTIIMLFSICVV